MAGVLELSAPYANLMFGPRPGPGVCTTCFNLTDGYARCYACDHGGDTLDVVLPVSYSVGGEQLHHALASYKRSSAPWAKPFVAQLAAVLWRFVERHEVCLARAAGVSSFPVVTTVPSGDPDRDASEDHALQRIVSRHVAPTRDRYRACCAARTRRASHTNSPPDASPPSRASRVPPCSSSTTPGRAAPARRVPRSRSSGQVPPRWPRS